MPFNHIDPIDIETPTHVKSCILIQKQKPGQIPETLLLFENNALVTRFFERRGVLPYSSKPTTHLTLRVLRNLLKQAGDEQKEAAQKIKIVINSLYGEDLKVDLIVVHTIAAPRLM